MIVYCRSNVVGTQFTLYDNGENPKKGPVIGEGARQELAAVIYVSYCRNNNFKLFIEDSSFHFRTQMFSVSKALAR